MSRTLLLFIFFYLKCFAITSQVNPIHFDYYQRLIFFNVTINGTDSLYFLFDTGANASAIDAVSAQKLNLKPHKTDSVEGSAGTIAVEMIKIKSIAAGDAKVKNLRFTTQDLSYMLAPPGKRVQGILGTDFMKHFTVTIDFVSHKISFTNQPGVHSATSIPFEMDNNIPRVRATINHSFQTFLRYDSGSSLFDTDSIYVNVTTPNWKAIQRADTSLKPYTYFKGTGIGGEIQLAVVPVKSFSFNDVPVQNAFIIVQPEQGYFARTDAVGFFGNNLLEKFKNVTIDFKTKKISVSR
jgi:hypothetical protein